MNMIRNQQQQKLRNPRTKLMTKPIKDHRLDYCIIDRCEHYLAHYNNYNYAGRSEFSDITESLKKKGFTQFMPL